MIVVQPHRCLACKACEMACAVEHSQSQDLYQAIDERPAPAPRVAVTQGSSFVAPLQCRQCADAPCMAICPTHALHRASAESPVQLEGERCIGCRWCVLACPFGVIRMDEEAHAIIKCDQCFARVQRDELPACVSACPTGALEFKTAAAVVAEKRAAFLVQVEAGLAGENR